MSKAFGFTILGQLDACTYVSTKTDLEDTHSNVLFGV